MIHIEGDIYIVSDKYQWNVAKLGVRKNNDGEDEEFMTYITHHNRIEGALESYLHSKARDKYVKTESCDAKSLEDAIKTFKNLNTETKKMLKECFEISGK